MKNPKCGHCYNGKSYNSFIGFKSGNLKILNIESKAAPNGVYRKYALCECICNNKKYFPFKNIVNGNTKKCGECYNGIPYSSFVGKKYGTLIVKSVYNSKEKLRWIADCECEICGKHSELSLTELNKYRKCIFCRKNETRKKYEYMIGNHFGHIKILKINNELKNGNITALCKCDCGNFCNISLSYLIRLIREKKLTSCGQCYNGIPYKDFIGKKYGYFTITKIFPANTNNKKRTTVNCKCDCGKEMEKELTSLLCCLEYSCGCFAKKYKYIKQISFGHLNIIRTSKKNLGGLRYICKCECGNEVEVLESDLFTEKVTCCEECETNKNDFYVPDELYLC